MNFKRSISSLSALGTIGLFFGLNLAPPLQKVQAASNLDSRLSSLTLIAQKSKSIRKQPERQRLIRQNLRQTQPTVKTTVRSIVRQSPPRPVVNPTVLQEQRKRQQEALNRLRERQRRDVLQKQEERQQNLREQVRENRLDIRRLNDRQRRFYRDYISYRNRNYFRDRYWVSRNYYSNRSFWSGPGYWYDREYWGRRGYIWDDVIGGIVGGLIQGAVSSAISSSTIYPYAPQILNRNRLSVTTCEPGTVVILLPNQRVMCAYPTATHLPGTYQVANSYVLVPAVVNNPYSY